MTVALAHPGGTENVKALVEGLAGARLLQRFVTTIARTGPSPRWMARRTYTGVSKAVIDSAVVPEVIRRLGGKTIDAAYRSCDRRLACRLAAEWPNAIYCFEDGALASFQAAEALGISRFLELPSPYWRPLLTLSEEEAERQPEWRTTLPALRDTEDKRERKDAELALADRVVVPSRFAAGTLGAYPAGLAPIAIVPYGAPLPRQRPERADGPLRVLYVGNLNQQKGLAYLLQAVERTSGVHLTLVGRKPASACRPLAQALTSHRFVAETNHEAVLRIMLQHDVLVFPTLYDGFGLVILEALACGLPVIATTNCAAPDIIADGIDGYVVPIRDVDAVVDRIDRLAADPRRLTTMSAAAQRTAAVRSWRLYQERIVSLVGGTAL